MMLSQFISDDLVKIDGVWYVIVADEIDTGNLIAPVFILRRVIRNRKNHTVYIGTLNVRIVYERDAENLEVEDYIDSGIEAPIITYYDKEDEL